MYRHLTLFALLLLGLTGGTALAQVADVEEDLTEELVDAEEYVEAEYESFKATDYDLTVLLPAGGTYYSPEDLGITAEDDPMDYPLIWVTEDTTMPFNMVMLGALDVDEEITDDDYQFYFEEFLRNVSADFPNLEREIDAVELHDRIWDRFVVGDDEGTTMVNYLTFIGDTFYSISFLSGGLTELDESIDATVAQLDITYLNEDWIPSETILLPWYF